MSLFNVSLVLLLIMDPIGNLSSYLTMVKELDPKRQYWIIIREMLIAPPRIEFLIAAEVSGEARNRRAEPVGA